MSDNKKILPPYYGEGLSQRKIAERTGISRNTISPVCKRADELKLDLNRIQPMSYEELDQLLFPDSRTSLRISEIHEDNEEKVSSFPLVQGRDNTFFLLFKTHDNLKIDFTNTLLFTTFFADLFVTLSDDGSVLPFDSAQII